MIESFEKYKKDSIRAAKDLRYGKTVVDKLKAAKTEAEVTNILKTARLSKDWD